MRADFQDAKIMFANLHKANFEGANLLRTDFYLSNLTGANLKGANLSGANFFFGANLQESELIREKGLKAIQVRKAYN